MNAKIKVILVDDHAVVRAGFRMLLAASESIEVIAEAERGEHALQLAQEHAADVIVMDLSMPGLGGLETIRRICQRDELAKILVFSVHDEMVYIDRAMAAGAKGYISKNSAPAMLPQAIEKVARGELFIEAGLVKDRLGRAEVTEYKTIINAFTAREFDVFCLLAKGLTVHKVADELCLGHKTVANYGTQIRAKLNVSTLAELAHIAVMLGLLQK